MGVERRRFHVSLILGPKIVYFWALTKFPDFKTVAYTILFIKRLFDYNVFEFSSKTNLLIHLKSYIYKMIERGSGSVLIFDFLLQASRGNGEATLKVSARSIEN